MKLLIDAHKCQGHGRCYALAPDLFDADVNGHAIVCVPEVPHDRLADAKLAVDNCPEVAIALHLETGSRGEGGC